MDWIEVLQTVKEKRGTLAVGVLLIGSAFGAFATGFCGRAGERLAENLMDDSRPSQAQEATEAPRTVKEPDAAPSAPDPSPVPPAEERRSSPQAAPARSGNTAAKAESPGVSPPAARDAGPSGIALPANQRVEAEGLVFQLKGCSLDGANRVRCRLTIASPGEDRTIAFGTRRNSTMFPGRSKLIDQAGYEYEHDLVMASGVANQSTVRPSVRRDTEVPAEISFPITRDVTGIRELLIEANTAPRTDGRNFSVSFR